MYSYALNNPLIYADPDGLYLKPSDWEREQSKERTYCSEIGWKMAGMMGSQFGSYMSRHASGGWEFSSPTGQYVNRFTGDRMSAAQFDSQYLNPAYIPASVDYGWGIVATMETEGYDLPINVFGRINTKIAANGGVSGDNLFVKTYLHFQFGGRDPLTIDASTLNFGNISKGDLKDKGNGRYGLNLYDKNPTSQTALALGKITLIDQGNNNYSIAPDYYDFNIERQNGFSQRNIATFGAGILHYGINPVVPSYTLVPIIFGGPYWIHFQGNVHIKP